MKDLPDLQVHKVQQAKLKVYKDHPVRQANQVQQVRRASKDHQVNQDRPDHHVSRHFQNQVLQVQKDNREIKAWQAHRSNLCFRRHLPMLN